MEKNKSIDGLAPRRSQKASSNIATRKTSSVSPKEASSRTASKSATKTTPKSKSNTYPKTTPPKSQKVNDPNHIPNPAKTQSSTPEPSSTKKSPIDITEDFLKPVQAFDFDEDSGELKVAKESTKKSSKKMKKVKKTPSKKRKIITSIILGLVVLLIGVVIWFILWGNDIIAKITGGQGNILDLFTFMEETYEPLKTDTNGRTNILAFGTSGYNMEGDEGNGTHDGAQLTDSIMVISLNQETGDVAMLSLPRDLKASPTCTATGKINEVYWCSNMDGTNEQAGAEALMTEVGSILGIDFQYYAHLNWGSLVQIVDTLGGINVTLDEDISDYYYTGSVYQAGVEYTLDGIQAVALSRARHGTASGDFSRGASQQKILIGIKNKVLEKELSLADLLSLASTLGDNLRTNFSLEEMKTLGHLATNFDFDTMRQISLIEPERLMTTGTINGISYVLPSNGVGNYHAIQTYVAKMFSNDPRSYEDYTILVLNATETPGLAGAEQASLAEDGYTNISVGDAPEGTYDEDYLLYSMTNTAPGTQKLLEEHYNATAKPASELPANIPTDYNFVVIVNTNDHSE